MDGSGPPIPEQILAYLIEHPQAQDTLEGVTEWWLLEQRIRYAVAEVDGVLQDLVADDLLMTRRGADGRVYYALNRAKEGEIRRRLSEAESARQTDTDPGPTEPQT